MAQKLYAAKVEMTFYFLAEEGEEQQVAQDNMDDALRDSERNMEPSVHEVKRFEHLLDVSSDMHQEELVYGVKGDITLKEAFELSGYDYQKEEEECMKRLGVKTD